MKISLQCLHTQAWSQSGTWLAQQRQRNKYVPALTLDRWIREYIRDPIIPPSQIVLNALSSMESNQPMGNFSTEGDTSIRYSVMPV